MSEDLSDDSSEHLLECGESPQRSDESLLDFCRRLECTVTLEHAVSDDSTRHKRFWLNEIINGLRDDDDLEELKSMNCFHLIGDQPGLPFDQIVQWATFKSQISTPAEAVDAVRSFEQHADESVSVYCHRARHLQHILGKNLNAYVVDRLINGLHDHEERCMLQRAQELRTPNKGMTIDHLLKHFENKSKASYFRNALYNLSQLQQHEGESAVDYCARGTHLLGGLCEGPSQGFSSPVFLTHALEWQMQVVEQLIEGLCDDKQRSAVAYQHANRKIDDDLGLHILELERALTSYEDHHKLHAEPTKMEPRDPLQSVKVTGAMDVDQGSLTEVDDTDIEELASTHGHSHRPSATLRPVNLEPRSVATISGTTSMQRRVTPDSSEEFASNSFQQ